MTSLRDDRDPAAARFETWQDPCRIRVRFDDPAIELTYQDERAVAATFAVAARAVGLRVSIDGQLQCGLPALPCRRLWT
ncbi:hypothetical protein GV794_09305 [Nocardia cyriacigeorgica]|uniref:Uncharacterized protein n=1 Tax=Nocardia cyriacigeorgica TaxID=135487 RepID=A0A6P1D8G4_9NOCA|nr:hypothetical protein [Nocardia cyriacigeorgica]NEW46757.1 hypothetical protein [Nocardia cyriacigeorgica]NEW55849.1 hypothetical protein [Nocardia cyriacigeorgica]